MPQVIKASQHDKKMEIHFEISLRLYLKVLLVFIKINF